MKRFLLENCCKNSFFITTFLFRHTRLKTLLKEAKILRRLDLPITTNKYYNFL